MKSTKNVVIGALIIVIVLMAIGYSTFATQLTVNGTAEITGVWNVKITNIDIQEVSEGCDPGTPQYTNTSVTFDSKLVKPGDYISYVITIQNAGTIDAQLDNVLFQEESEGSPAINYVTTEIAHELKAGEQTTFTVKAEYIKSTTEVPTIKTRSMTGIIEYVQK